jgi:hypothetical protein
MLAAFREDRLMLEREAEAVFDHKFAQTERNPIVREVNALYQKQRMQQCRARLLARPLEQVPSREILSQVGRGELAVFDPGGPSPLTHDELRERLDGAAMVNVRRYWQYALLAGGDAA